MHQKEMLQQSKRVSGGEGIRGAIAPERQGEGRQERGWQKIFVDGTSQGAAIEA